MIYWGYDAEGRMERVYQKGGSQALLREIDSMKDRSGQDPLSETAFFNRFASF